MLKHLIFALRFFTRLPILGNQAHDGDLADTAYLFPFVGLIIGILLAIIWWGLSVFLPALPAAGLTIAIGMMITGALHEDGFSDCADGLGGSQTKTRALEIMRDSRIGAYGAAALIVSIGLRWTALAEQTIIAGMAALIVAHCVSRTAIIIALATSHYARDKGLGSSVAAGVDRQALWVSVIIALLLSLLIGGGGAVLAGLLAFLFAWLFLKYLVDRLGGYTGDGLGAMQQVAEITVFLTLAGFWAA